MKSRKVKNAKVQNSSFVRTTNEENAGEVWRNSIVIWGRSDVFGPIGSHIREKEKNGENWKTQFFFQKFKKVWTYGQATTEIWKKSAQKIRDNCDTGTTDGTDGRIPIHDLYWYSQAELSSTLGVN